MNTTANTIDEAFERICHISLNKTAVSDNGIQLTYHDIHHVALQCEQVIRQLVPTDDTPVIVCMANQSRLYGLFLGIMKIGRPYYYIEPNEHPEIKRQLAKKAGGTLVIGECIHDYQAYHIDVERIFNHKLVLDDRKVHKKEIHIPCCLVQTSASTQDTRVVAIRHSALMHHIKQFHSTLTITSDDHIGLLSSPKFSASTAAIYGALLSGASFSPFLFQSDGLDALIEWIEREQLTVLHTTPSLFRMIAHYAPKRTLFSIRAVKLGGETLYQSDFELFKEKFSDHCILINGLGMSEIGGNITHYVLSRSSILPPNLDVIPVGHVLAGHQIRVVDDQKKDLPLGKSGEIVVSSPFIAEGYWNATSDENSQFKQVHSETQSLELFTNDIGYFLPNGALIHSGRKNRLFKRLGLRVDLNHIESVLLRFNNIHHVAAYLVDIGNGNEVYVVSIQLIDKRNDSIESILSSLRMILPEHMIPQCIFLVDCLPMTASGKIDRQTLIQAHIEQHRSRVIVPPRNEVEEALVQIWKEIFGINAISIDDNFFALGGNSLISMALFSRIKTIQQLEHHPKYLVMKPTIAQIAEDIYIQRANRELTGHKHNIPLQASVLSLRKGTSSKQKPMIFLSGGAMSEKEIELITQLLPYLSPEYAVYAIRLNVLHEHCDIPSSIDAITSLIVRQILNLDLTCPPVLVGECIACVLTTHVAKKLSEQLNIAIDVLLLNPWHPRGIVTTDIRHPTTSKAYFLDLLKYALPEQYHGAATLVLPQEQVLTHQDYIKWWEKTYGIECQLQGVLGDVSSYIRIHQEDLTKFINLYMSNKHSTINLTGS